MTDIPAEVVSRKDFATHYHHRRYIMHLDLHSSAYPAPMTIVARKKKRLGCQTPLEARKNQWALQFSVVGISEETSWWTQTYWVIWYQAYLPWYYPSGIYSHWWWLVSSLVCVVASRAVGQCLSEELIEIR
jgi:hypothetical protein